MIISENIKCIVLMASIVIVFLCENIKCARKQHYYNNYF